MRPHALNATQKTQALYKVRFLKKIKKNLQISPCLTKTLKNGNFLRYYLIFAETILCKELGFFVLHSVHQDASFELSKTAFGQFFRFFIIRGSQNLRQPLNLVKNQKEKLFWNQQKKTSTKTGGRSLMKHFGQFCNSLQYGSDTNCSI